MHFCEASFFAIILFIFIENLFLMYSKLHLINSMHKMAVKRFLENVSNIAFQYPIQIKGIVSLLYCKMIFLCSLYYKYHFYPFLWIRWFQCLSENLGRTKNQILAEFVQLLELPKWLGNIIGKHMRNNGKPIKTAQAR